MIFLEFLMVKIRGNFTYTVSSFFLRPKLLEFPLQYNNKLFLLTIKIKKQQTKQKYISRNRRNIAKYLLILSSFFHICLFITGLECTLGLIVLGLGCCFLFDNGCLITYFYFYGCSIIGSMCVC